MPTRKIADEHDKVCFHPEHNPPSHQVFEPGTYEHECPACHRKQIFRVRGVYLTTRSGLESRRPSEDSTADEVSYGAASPFPLPRSWF